ncbi:hypothetical protein BGX26_006279 [Mortierella sp. AD094]|nr:hypothetical protein BGX26_006279 [Mortierella sp. AD094]
MEACMKGWMEQCNGVGRVVVVEPDDKVASLYGKTLRHETEVFDRDSMLGSNNRSKNGSDNGD